MFLPKLPYNFLKASQDVIGFSGLNRTENFKDGQLRDCLGLSSENYPTLTQSKPFVAADGQSGITDMYEHNGKLLLVMNDGRLIFDGKKVGTVTPGKKQFATVNTRLCIFPDKVYIDLNTMELSELVKSVTAPRVPNAVWASDFSLSIIADAPYISGKKETFGDMYEYPHKYLMYTYGTNYADVAARWDDENKIWLNLSELKNERCLVAWAPTEDVYHPGELETGDIFIPQISGDKINIVTSEGHDGTPDISLYNSQGVYCVVTAKECVLEDEYGNEIPDWEEAPVYYITNTYTYDCFRATDNTKLFSDIITTGDLVDVKNTPLSLFDGSGIKTEKISEDGRTLYFADDTFSGAVSALTLTEDISGEKTLKMQYYRQEGDNPDESVTAGYYSVFIHDTVKAGKILYFKDFKGDSNLYVWDTDKLSTVGKYEATYISGVSEADITLEPYTLDKVAVKVSKHIPDLDYICESENRLWGVSNRTHTIYASALGLPGEFTEFDVISTDSYAVAVASEDDFTAICAYGGGVCCFKENRLHKMLGSYPAEYYMNEYEVAGVQKGSERSLQIIDEVLYFKGKYGIYAYSGGVPKLISYELGNVADIASASASDGMNYYISLGDGIYAYDKLHGLWMKQTAAAASAMVTVDSTVTLLSDGALYSNTGNRNTADWTAEFTPFDQTLISKKGYSKLILSLEMEKGSSFGIWIKENRLPWRKVHNQAATEAMTVSVPLRIGRCDRFSFKIEGKGRVTLRGIVRDIIIGSK